MKKVQAISAFLLMSLSYAVAGLPITGMVTADHTINVPADFATIQSALDYLNDKTFKAGVTLTIQVADNTYSNYGTIEMVHPQGDQIHIVGNTTTPANCTIEFSGAAVFVTNGKKIGLIDGFVFKGLDNAYDGVYAEKSSVINLGANMVVKEFNQGIYAAYGATIDARDVESSHHLSHGFIAYTNGQVNADNGYTHNNGQSGATAWHSGSVSFFNGVSEYNTKHGVHAFWDGTVVANGCTVRYNGQYGFTAQHMALVYATSATNTGNSSGSFSELNSARVIQ